MIKELEKSGKTPEDAISKALEELGLERDDVSVVIVERGKSGFLGLGAVDAVVRVSYEVSEEEPVKESEAPAPKPAQEKRSQPRQQPKTAEPAQAAAAAEEAPKQKKARRPETEQAAETEQFLTGLLERMGVEAEIEIKPRKGGGLDVDLSGSGIGAVIGRRGETLDAIQHLTNYVVNRGSDKHAHINVDAENYRAKREDSLRRLAEKMAQKAIKYKRSMALEPMNSYERHVIHAALQDYEGVTTSSTGTEPNRRVVVSYVPQEEKQTSGSDYKEWC